MGARPFRAPDAFLQGPPALRLRLRLGCRDERRVRAFLLCAFLAHPAGTYEHSIERLMLVAAFFSYDAPLYREEGGGVCVVVGGGRGRRGDVCSSLRVGGVFFFLWGGTPPTGLGAAFQPGGIF